MVFVGQGMKAFCGLGVAFLPTFHPQSVSLVWVLSDGGCG